MFNFILKRNRLLNDAEIAKSKRDFELKKAAYDVEVQTKVSRENHGSILFLYALCQAWATTFFLKSHIN